MNSDAQGSSRCRSTETRRCTGGDGSVNFDQGDYTFTAITSGGMRVYVDGTLILDSWRDQPATVYNVNRSLSQGNHLVVVEYYEHTGLAAAHLLWQAVSATRR